MPVETEFEGLDPEEAIRHFRRRLNLPTQRWDDILGAAHDRAFVVAGASRSDLLAGLRGAVDKALADGESLGQFRKRFDAIVASTGWDHHGKRGWRSALIYRQNLQSAYAAGRYEQMTDEETLEERPYWLYRHGGSADPRPDHISWDGLVLAASDPWWQTHYPPNGYGCSCSAFALDEEAARARGIASEAPDDGTYIHERVNSATGEIEELRVPKGVTPGFDAAPGESWLRRFTPSLSETPPPKYTPAPGAAALPDLPTDTLHGVSILPEGNAEGAVAAFLRRFGRELDDRDYIHEDMLGERLPVNQYMFRATHSEKKWKLASDGPYKSREKWLEYLAETIKDPAEIRVHLEPLEIAPEHGIQYYVIRRYYIRRMDTGGKARDFAAVYSSGRGRPTWNMQVVDPVDEGIDQYRRGLLLYERPRKREL